ncbi:MAG TPA: SRPBCC family protein [Opitutaceae bacterium]|jgi:uncharacterized protein YndB with AHSA1/START domain|nr:SRPBCC family protein [Opitutaceae bacterium]
MNTEENTPNDIARRSIVVSRTYDAPRELVFSMWTDPVHIVKWWGPSGFTNTVQEMDVRPGGAWRHTMHGPDGVDYKNDSVYVDVKRPSLLSYQHSAPRFLATVTFVEDGAGTKVTLSMVFPDAELRDRIVRDHNAIEGGNQTLGRLAELLSKETR